MNPTKHDTTCSVTKFGFLRPVPWCVDLWCWFWMGGWVSMDQLSHPNRIDFPSNPTSPPIRPEASSNRTRDLDWMGPGVGPLVPSGCNCTRVGHPEGPSLLASRIAGVHLDRPDRSLPPRSLTKGVHLVGCVCRVWFRVWEGTSQLVRVLRRRRAHEARLRTRKRTPEGGGSLVRPIRRNGRKGTTSATS